MSLADEFVKRLAAVECDAERHPILPARPIESHDPWYVPGYVINSAGVSMTESYKANLDLYIADLKARCPFCIARDALKSQEGKAAE